MIMHTIIDLNEVLSNNYPNDDPSNQSNVKNSLLNTNIPKKTGYFSTNPDDFINFTY